MQGVHGMQELEIASVIKVAREPAIIINGVPNLTPDCIFNDLDEVQGSTESQVDPHFAEWLEGRKVRKLFGDKYYLGKVVKYDSESNWYSIVYEDGDQEDLEWHELEEVLLPLDITTPLKTLVMEKLQLEETVNHSRPKVLRPRHVHAYTEVGTKNAADVLPISRSSGVMNDQVVVIGMENSQESRLKAGAPRTNCVKGEGSMEITPKLLPMPISNQPRKRGRPRKDRTISGNSNQLVVLKMEENAQVTQKDSNQRRKRGRPRKDRTVYGNPQGSESTPSSLILVPMAVTNTVQDTSISTDVIVPSSLAPVPVSVTNTVQDTSISTDTMAPSSLVSVPITVTNTVQDPSISTDIIGYEASRKQNELLRRYMQTARAEKLKRRENSLVQGSPPGTQLF